MLKVSDFGYSKDKLNNWMNEQPKIKRGQLVYWMVTENDGKMVVLGFRETEDLALQYLSSVGVTNYTIEPLRTTDTNKCVRILKSKRLNETGNLNEALQKFGRKL